MPTYDYQCDACGHTFEEFQGFSEKPLKKCPSCGKLKLRRLLGTGAAILFKGSGFYQTDYRSESYKQAAKADEAKSAPAANGTSGTSGKDTASSTTPAPAASAPAKSDSAGKTSKSKG